MTYIIWALFALMAIMMALTVNYAANKGNSDMQLHASLIGLILTLGFIGLLLK
jgi:hypothetical protein